MVPRNKTFICIIFIIAFSFCSYSCSDKKHTSVTAGIYHWKTVFDPDAGERKWLRENHIQKLYLRMFDVDWNETLKQPIPAGDVQIRSNELHGVEIIPSVFITNRTLINLPDTSVSLLASKIAGKISSKMKNAALPPFMEIQLDCDWTEKTRDKYFSLIRKVKLLSGCGIISATIRLHQIKYFSRTGVPPVDRGMLMFYNMGSVDNILVRNSIFDTETAKQYLYNFDKYPLRLDVVLPAFSWGALFRRGKLISLINDLEREDLIKNGKFKELTHDQFICRNAEVINGISCYENDLIRIESVTAQTTESAAKLISGYLKEENLTVALYHLNKEMVRRYETTKIENIYSHFN